MHRALLLTLLWVAPIGGCSPRPPTLVWPQTTAHAVAESWAGAFNAQQPDQLRLLVHPSRRAAFDEARPTFRLGKVSIQRFDVAGRLVVDDRYDARDVTYWYHDGAAAAARRVVVAEVDGRWWVWTF